MRIYTFSYKNDEPQTSQEKAKKQIRENDSLTKAAYSFPLSTILHLNELMLILD